MDAAALEMRLIVALYMWPAPSSAGQCVVVAVVDTFLEASIVAVFVGCVAVMDLECSDYVE